MCSPKEVSRPCQDSLCGYMSCSLLCWPGGSWMWSEMPRMRHIPLCGRLARSLGEELNVLIGHPGPGTSSVVDRWGTGKETPRQCWAKSTDGDHGPYSVSSRSQSGLLSGMCWSELGFRTSNEGGMGAGWRESLPSGDHQESGLGTRMQWPRGMGAVDQSGGAVAGPGEERVKRAQRLCWVHNGVIPIARPRGGRGGPG